MRVFACRLLPGGTIAILLAMLLLAAGCPAGGSAPTDGGHDGDGGGSGDGPGADAPLDSDNDGIPDEVEDANGNGRVDAGETDPHNPDSDGDGLPDGIEDGNHNGRIDWAESDPLNSDSDGDGIADGAEDANHNGRVDAGESDPLKQDSDHDGLPDGLEDANHDGRRDPGETDPSRADSDSDGLLDGQEDRNSNGRVDAGETDPNNPDMDGDGVADGDEDRDGDGRLGDCRQSCSSDGDCPAGQVCARRARVCYSSLCSRGETDPFDGDTDADGIGDDREASTRVCAAEKLKQIDFHSSEDADFRLALERFFAETSILRAGAGEVGMMFYSPDRQAAGLLLARAPSGNTPVEQEAMDRATLGQLGQVLGASTRSLQTFDGHPAVLASYDLEVTEQSLVGFAGQLAGAWYPAPLTGLLPEAGTVTGSFRLSSETIFRAAGESLLLAVLSPRQLLDEAQQILLNDVTNSTALAGHTDQTLVACDTFLSPGADQVDFIWVVDNSESMAEEQNAVAAAGQAMASLLAYTTIDWRVAVTNTDAIYDGLLWSGFIRDIDRFRDDIRQGTGGSPLERTLDMGLRALDHSLEGGCTPAGSAEDRYRLRCGATRVVVFLTDEDDEVIEQASGGENYSGEPDAATVAGYIDSYTGRQAVLFAIAGGNPRCPTALNASKGIDAVVHGVGGGAVGSICDGDQTANVEQIVRVASGASSTFQLAHPAISATLKVAAVLDPLLGPEEIPRGRSDGFDYDGVANAIVFYGLYRPALADQDVAVSYRYFVECISAPEECDGRDNDCDGLTDEDFDSDGDGWAACTGDCDDGRADVHPGAEELCDGFDNDCDGDTDEGFDADGDGFRTCDGDCDDGNPVVFPGAPELCDGLDNDCDDIVDPEWACG